MVIFMAPDLSELVPCGSSMWFGAHNAELRLGGRWFVIDMLDSRHWNVDVIENCEAGNMWIFAAGIRVYQEFHWLACPPDSSGT